MYVCICNAITDYQVREALTQGKGSLRELRDHLGVATTCGKCAQCVKELIKEHREAYEKACNLHACTA